MQHKVPNAFRARMLRAIGGVVTCLESVVEVPEGAVAPGGDASGPISYPAHLDDVHDVVGLWSDPQVPYDRLHPGDDSALVAQWSGSDAIERQQRAQEEFLIRKQNIPVCEAVRR